MASASQLRDVQSGSRCGSSDHRRRLLGKIVDRRRIRQAAQKCALLRDGIERFLVGLIGGQPEVLAQRIVVAIDAHRARRTAQKSAEALAGNKVRIVQLVVPDANVHAHEAVARRRARDQRAELRHDGAFVEIEQAVLDVIRFFLARQHQPRPANARVRHAGQPESYPHLPREPARSPARPALRRRCAVRGGVTSVQLCRPHQPAPSPPAPYQHGSFANSDRAAHWRLSVCSCHAPAAARWAAGRSKLSFFCTSISVISMAGADADTGTEPDSAPQ